MVSLILALAVTAAGVSASARPEVPPVIELAQTRQQPFFDRFPEPPAPEKNRMPTPQLTIKPNPSQQGTFTATDSSGQSYRVRPAPFSGGWYDLQDQSGRTVYQVRPDARGPGTYEVKP